MKQKIKTHIEVAQRRAAINAAKELQASIAKEEMEKRELAVKMLIYDKALCYGIVNALAVEYNDYMKATTHYSKAFKRDADRTHVHSLKISETLYLDMYKQDALFTHNFTQVFERVITKLASLQFADWPLFEQLFEEFVKDKQFYRENIVAQFNNLDVKKSE